MWQDAYRAGEAQATTELDNLRYEFGKLKLEKSSKERLLEQQVVELQQKMFHMERSTVKQRSPSPPSWDRHHSYTDSPHRFERGSSSVKDSSIPKPTKTVLFYEKYHEPLSEIMFYSHLVSEIDDENSHLLKGLTLTYEGQSVNLETALYVANI